MPVGSGFKTFATGDVLTAAQVNGYLMQQSIQYYANTTARDTAYPSPATGATCYLASTNLLYNYNGTTWVPAGSLVPHIDVFNGLTGSGTTASTSYVNLPGASVAALSVTKYRADTKLVISLGVQNHYTSLADFTTMAVRVNAVDYFTSQLGVAGAVRRTQYGTVQITGLAANTYTIQPRVKIDGGAGGTMTLDTSCYYNIVCTESF